MSDEERTTEGRAPAMSDDDSPQQPMVSVIIPVYNDVAGLRRCLTALVSQDYPADRYEVVVVDNASTEDVRAAVPEGSRFRVLREGRRGSYAARNTGVAAARGAVLAFTDGDCVPHQDWLRRGVEALHGESRPHAVGGAIHLTFPHGPSPRTGPEHYELLQEFQQRKYIEQWSFAATANLFVSTEEFHRVGPFNADLLSGGDLDWGRRMGEKGGRLAYCPETVIDHPARSSWRELGRKSLRVANGLADRARGTGKRELARLAARDARNAAAVWVNVWRSPSPPTGGAKVRYAAAFSYVRLLRASVKVRRLASA